MNRLMRSRLNHRNELIQHAETLRLEVLVEPIVIGGIYIRIPDGTWDFVSCAEQVEAIKDMYE